MGLTDGRTGRRPPRHSRGGGCIILAAVLAVALASPVVAAAGFAFGLIAH